MELIIMANDAAHPLLARADAVILETRRLQAEMDRTVTIAELNAQRLERTYLAVRTMISRRSPVKTSNLNGEIESASVPDVLR
jgi:hypothetical protein